MRISWDQHFMQIAREVSRMGTCARRQVGAVIVNKSNQILGTGFNGVPPNWPHCRFGSKEDMCPGALAPSGTSIDQCYANHAEINALLNTSNLRDAYKIYVTCSPCISCVKALLVTSIAEVHFENKYPNSEESEALWTLRPSRNGAKRLWLLET